MFVHVASLTAVLLPVLLLPPSALSSDPLYETHGCPPINTVAHFIVDPDNCQLYYHCDNSVARPRTCPPGTHFSDLFNTCTHQFSHQDTCAQDNAPRECSKRTYLGTIPHPRDCKRFYDCSDTAPNPPGSVFEDYEKECPGDLLFDIALKRCISPQWANCGQRRM